MKKVQLLLFLGLGLSAQSQTYPPQEGTAGTTAIFKDSPLFVAWATGMTVERGFINKSNPSATANGSNKASHGVPEDAIGAPSSAVVSLGDEGSATATFASPIYNGEGFDFAVFENGGPSFLELAFVEVSSDGEHFFRFPAHSQTQTATQIGSFGSPSAPYLNNLAGKYGGQYGTPFDLSELEDNVLLNKNSITHVKVIDVVGTINPTYATYDSFGNMVNDPFPTAFATGGFDLSAIGVINQGTLSRGDFAKDDIKIYPNPASDYFRIQSEEETRIMIYDVSGRLVLDKITQSNQQVNVSSLTSGVYIVQITVSAQGKKSTQRLIIR